DVEPPAQAVKPKVVARRPRKRALAVAQARMPRIVVALPSVGPRPASLPLADTRLAALGSARCGVPLFPSPLSSFPWRAARTFLRSSRAGRSQPADAR